MKREKERGEEGDEDGEGEGKRGVEGGRGRKAEGEGRGSSHHRAPRQRPTRAPAGACSPTPYGSRPLSRPHSLYPASAADAERAQTRPRQRGGRPSTWPARGDVGD